MSLLYVTADHPLNQLPEELRNRLAAAQKNLVEHEFVDAAALAGRVFADLKIAVGVPTALSDKPVLEFADLPFRELCRTFFDALIAAGVAEASVDTLSKSLAQRCQLVRAFPDPDTTLNRIETKIVAVANDLPRTAADLERGRNPGDVLDPYILAASQHLLFAGDFGHTVEAAVSHKALMIIEGLIGHLHEDVLGEMRGNVRAPEPRGAEQEKINFQTNPFPGADLVQPPWSPTIPLRFHQIKNKTGSAKGGDGKRLGDQLQRLQQTYGGQIFYDALIGNTLRGHRSRAGVEGAAPSVAVLVGEAAFEAITASRQGPQLLLRVYQAAFQEVARKSGYSVELVSAVILESFRSRAEQLGEGFLESVLRVATCGPLWEQDSRERPPAAGFVTESPESDASWLFTKSAPIRPVVYRSRRQKPKP